MFGHGNDGDTYADNDFTISGTGLPPPPPSAGKTNGSTGGPPRLPCFARFVGELDPIHSPWFAVQEVNGRKIDIPESFAPGSCFAFLNKMVVMGTCVGYLIYSWQKPGQKASFFLAYLTNWALLLSCLYSIMSLLNTIMAGRTPQPPQRVGSRIVTTWILFALAAHTELLVTILYWVLVYDYAEEGRPDWTAPFSHGVILLLVWYDGLVVNRIPVRWTHWYGFVFVLDGLYLLWSGLHALFEIGNPDEQDNDPTTNDDLVYTALDWQGDWIKTLITAAICWFVLSPLLYLLLWLCSSYPAGLPCYKERRRYLDSYEDEDHQRPTVNDVEEGSIFARFW